VRTAVEVLGANRVMHGVSAASDPVLLEDLAQRGTVLDVCPTSNLMLSAADSYQAHPLPVLLRYGVACSLGADDPLLFDTDLLSEYAAARDRMRLTDRDLAEVAAASLRASGAPPVLVDEQIARVSNWLAAS
jgi:adenosine deaminase